MDFCKILVVLISGDDAEVVVNPGMLFTSMTKIRNSDGETFDATAGNIQVAIDSTSPPGTVWVPSGTYHPSGTIVINEGITLDLCGAIIKPLSAYGNIVWLEKDAHFWNGFLDCTSIVMSDHADCSGGMLFSNQHIMDVGYSYQSASIVF
jgi:polygalacturonase